MGWLCLLTVGSLRLRLTSVSGYDDVHDCLVYREATLMWSCSCSKDSRSERQVLNEAHSERWTIVPIAFIGPVTASYHTSPSVYQPGKDCHHYHSLSVAYLQSQMLRTWPQLIGGKLVEDQVLGAETVSILTRVSV